MPYPAKTTAPSIIAAAIAQLETSGQASLSLRTLASALGITPRALYRYFPDRTTLEAAVAEASYQELLDAMRGAADRLPPRAAVAAAAQAYLAFAAEHPARYGLLLAAPHGPATKSQTQEAVWQFVLELLARVTGHPDTEDVALAMWALLHGFVSLERAGIAQERVRIERGLAVFLAGLASSAAP